ncbi:MAG: exodeoxyribonuclease VII small subunit [Deltaproteobacteria bacterium]|nr:exodeoxyribonuclease VII small subunit [Deltaproteobacteria bacterium]
MASKKKDDREHQKEPGFDETLAKLSLLVEALESAGLSLEESLGLFEKGMAMVRQAETMLDQAEQKVERLVSGGATPHTEPFAGPLENIDP